MKEQFIDFKKGVDINDIKYLNPYLMMAIYDLAAFLYPYKKRVMITSAIRDPNDGMSKSTTHQTCRAVDISVRGFDKDFIDAILSVFNAKYKHIGALSSKDLKPRFMVYHNAGYGDHIHCQVRPDLLGE